MSWLIAGAAVGALLVRIIWPIVRRRLEDAGVLGPPYPKKDVQAMGVVTANALAQFETLFNPAMEHVIAVRRGGDLAGQGSGEPDGDRQPIDLVLPEDTPC